MSSFHYDFILSKRSSLAKVWLAAHWEKKLSKVQVFETNLQSSVHDILHPITPIALRTSSHLLLGLVRIYSRKAKYLLSDCSETLVNIKVTFRPGLPTFDTPKKKKCARDVLDCPFLITEKVDLLDQWVPEVSNADMDCSLNQSKLEEITLQEEPMKVATVEDYSDDEGFGDMFESESGDQDPKDSKTVFSRVYSFADSGCGTEDGFLCDTSSVKDFSDPFFALTPIKDEPEGNSGSHWSEMLVDEVNDAPPVFTLESDEEMPKTRTPVKQQYLEPVLEIELGKYEKDEKDEEDDSDVFTLDPIEATRLRQHRSRKSLKRKLLIDHEISISREAFFDQLYDSSKLIRQPIFAPTSKRRMKQLVANNLQTLFSLTSLQRPQAPCFQDIFQCSHFHKNSKSSIVSEKEVPDFETNEIEDFTSEFIPLRDVEYSSDEDDLPGRPVLDSAETVSEEIPCATSSEEAALDLDKEVDISQDEFCEFVEATVLEARPNPIDFSRVACSGITMTKKNVARRFLKCLLMQRDARLRLEQASHFSEIRLYPGAKHGQHLEV